MYTGKFVFRKVNAKVETMRLRLQLLNFKRVDPITVNILYLHVCQKHN